MARNKTHFFLAYEYVNVDRPLTVSIPLTSPLSRENGTFPGESQSPRHAAASITICLLTIT